jgi:hypothetical protein
MGVTRHLWGVSATVLGTWEAVAITTHRVPTISALTWRGLGCRHRVLVKCMVLAYLLGLGRHLLRAPPPS